MAGETQITLVGNLVDDPELRFTNNGAAVASFRVASTPRRFNKNTNEWEDQEAIFLTCSVWRQYAENVAESLQRGMRVIVQGSLKQRSYEAKDGSGKRTVYEIDVEEVGPALRSATAKVTKVQRQGGGNFGGGNGRSQDGGYGNQGGGFGGQQGNQGAPAQDPWATGGGFGGGNEPAPF